MKHPTLGNIDLYDKEIKKLIYCFLADYGLYLTKRKMYRWNIEDIINTARELDLLSLEFNKEWGYRTGRWLSKGINISDEIYG